MNTARIALIVAASVTAAGARDIRSDFAVSVVVRPMAELELRSAPAGLDISAADLRRGYIDVPQPTQVTVRSNSPNGYALEILTVAPLLSLASNAQYGISNGMLPEFGKPPSPALVIT